MDPVSVATTTNVSAQVNNIPKLSGTNFKIWKENVEIVLGCMDLDLALRSDRPIATEDDPKEVKIEKWDRSNRMSLMIMRRSIPEAFRGSITESENAEKFLESIEQCFHKNEKSEASSLLASLVSMKYKGKGNIREYIMEMSHLTSKLKALKLELSDDLLVHLILIMGYSDSDFAGCQDSKRSTSGYVFTLAGEAISWKSVKQTLIASSTMAAEFIACYETSNHRIWLRNFVTRLRVVDGIERPLRICCDNSSVVLYSNNNRSSVKSKFIKIKFLVVKERVQNKQISIEHIRTDSMLADPLTKAVTPKLFHELLIWVLFKTLP